MSIQRGVTLTDQARLCIANQYAYQFIIIKSLVSYFTFFLQTGDICKDDLKKIKAKTLIIHGIKDPLVPLEHPDYLHHHIKGSRYHYPGGGDFLDLRMRKSFRPNL